MQAIETKYVPATNHKGSRVIARSSSGQRVTLDWDHAKNSEGNHLAAARALAEKFDWFGTWVSGGSLSGKGEVFVCISDYDVTTHVGL